MKTKIQPWVSEDHYHIKFVFDQRARRIAFLALMAVTFTLATATTFGVLVLAETSWPLALLTALIWAAWITFSLFIIHGLNFDDGQHEIVSQNSIKRTYTLAPAHEAPYPTANLSPLVDPDVEDGRNIGLSGGVG